MRPGKGKQPEPIDAKQVETAIVFLAHFNPTKAGRVNSYSIKHAAERWGGRSGMSSYVSNGAAIAAALHLGFVVSEYPTPWFLDPGPNALIGIGWGELKRFIAEEPS